MNTAPEVDLSRIDLAGIASALGLATHTPYAPPHVYPMSAPNFERVPEAPRPRPETGRLGLYVHVPFCNYSCSFCFYARRIGDGPPQMEPYVAALLQELKQLEKGHTLTQLYVGGGTPTALPASMLDEILGAALDWMEPEGRALHTVEGSPESLTQDHVRVFEQRGIGRISLGVQSLDQSVLDRVHREHHVAEALSACDRLVAGGRYVNIDLIYGLPGQSEESFRNDFETIAGRGVHSVTVYNLRTNERTAVSADLGPEDELNMGRLVRWRAHVQRTARENGFTQKSWHRFERQSAASFGFEDRTSEGDQFGIGLSARSRLSSVIYRNHQSMAPYLDRIAKGKSPVEEVFRLKDEDWQIRYVAQTIGLGKELRKGSYRDTFGRAFDDDYGPLLENLQRVDLIADQDGAVQLTPTGKLLHDLVTLSFYPRHIQEWIRDRHQASVAKRSRAR